MSDKISNFESIVRKASLYTDARAEQPGSLHPFEERNIHPALPNEVKSMFDNGHYAQATFEAFKFIDKEVERHSKLENFGTSLMEQAFAQINPPIELTLMKTKTEKNEQLGFQRIFSGSVLAIRNPRGHEFSIKDTPDQCLDHLALASLLLRRLEQSGFKPLPKI